MFISCVTHLTPTTRESTYYFFLYLRQIIRLYSQIHSVVQLMCYSLVGKILRHLQNNIYTHEALQKYYGILITQWQCVCYQVCNALIKSYIMHLILFLCSFWPIILNVHFYQEDLLPAIKTLFCYQPAVMIRRISFKIIR